MPDVPEALLNPYPGLQLLLAGDVIRIQLVGPAAFLYLPAAHGAQAPSFEVAPSKSAPADRLENAFPALQVLCAGNVILSHGDVPVVALYFPAPHNVHVPSFDVAPSKSGPADELLTSLP